MDIANRHIVPDRTNPVRLTEYVLRVSEDLLSGIVSRNFAKKLIKRGRILVNGKPGTTALFVSPGMKIELLEEDRKPAKIFELKLPVIYEDDHLAVINKPAGIVVSGNRFRTVENALLYNLKLSDLSDALHQPRPVHRLDALTSGLLIIAKTRSTRHALGDMFSTKQIEKTYQAVVIGKIQKNGVIEIPIEEKPASTEYRIIRTVRSLKCEWVSLLEVKPGTGRTHQIRIHLAEIGHPILGDKLYGQKEYLFKGKGLFLSATGLKFNHPITKKVISISIEPPTKFAIHLERETRRWKKYN